MDDVTRLATFTDALDAWRVGRAHEAADLFRGSRIPKVTRACSQADFVHLFAGHALTTVGRARPSAGTHPRLQQARAEYDAIGPGSAIATRAELPAKRGMCTCRRSAAFVSPAPSTSRVWPGASANLQRIARDASASPVARLVGDVNSARVEQCRLSTGLPGDAMELEALARVRSFLVDVEGPQAQVVRELKALGAALQGERAAAAEDLQAGIALMREAIELSDGLADRGRWWAFVSVWQLRLCDLSAGQKAQGEALTNSSRRPASKKSR